MDELPVQASTYALILHLQGECILPVGKLGCYHLPAGYYVYLGSARGPGGLRARLGRHLSGKHRAHWHIDHLRAVAPVVGYCYVVLGRDAGTSLSECAWREALARLPGASFPVPGFGASDCTSGCPTHLIHFRVFDFIDQIPVVLQDTFGRLALKCRLLEPKVQEGSWRAPWWGSSPGL